MPLPKHTYDLFVCMCMCIPSDTSMTTGQYLMLLYAFSLPLSLFCLILLLLSMFPLNYGRNKRIYMAWELFAEEATLPFNSNNNNNHIYQLCDRYRADQSTQKNINVGTNIEGTKSRREKYTQYI